MNSTQEILSDEEVKSVDPVKLEWRRYGAHYKCDVNINDIASFWCFAYGNNIFVPVILSPKFDCKFLNTMKLEDARSLIDDWNNTLASCGYSVNAWWNKSRKISQ